MSLCQGRLYRLLRNSYSSSNKSEVDVPLSLLSGHELSVTTSLCPKSAFQSMTGVILVTKLIQTLSVVQTEIHALGCI